MAFTRKSIADHLDSYDDEIAELQDSKREMLADYRQQLADAGMGKAQIKAEIEALKTAMRRRRAIAKKGNETVEEADALADEIFVEITARAPRAMRVASAVPDHDPVTGEITDTHEQPKVEAHDAEACDTHSNAVDPASIKADGRANMEPDDVDRSAERASSAVEVGAPVSPEGATVSASSGRPEGRKRLQVAREPINAAEPDVGTSTRRGVTVERPIRERQAATLGSEDGGVTAGETAPIPHSAETPPAADKPETAVTPHPAVSGAISKPLNPDCRKAVRGEQCALMHSQALCSKCQREKDARRVAA